MMPHNENPAYYDPESTVVMDSKGLFDALDNDLPQDDQKICSGRKVYAQSNVSISMVSAQSKCS